MAEYLFSIREAASMAAGCIRGLLKRSDLNIDAGTRERMQAVVAIADEAESKAGPYGRLEDPAVDNGNTFVFCDYVDERHRGCVRGAGHNGPHAVCAPPYPLGPVLLAGPDGRREEPAK